MPNSILSSLFSKATFSITTASGTTTATGAKIVSVKVKYDSIVHKHMREDGVTIVDARTIRPTRLVVEMICPDLNTLSQITQVANERISLYTVSSKGLIFNNMKVDDETISQMPKMLTASPIKVSFVQQLVQYQQPVIFLQSADSSLIDRGIVSLQTVGQTASGVYNSVTSLL